jgi:hypothetical protein
MFVPVSAGGGVAGVGRKCSRIKKPVITMNGNEKMKSTMSRLRVLVVIPCQHRKINPQPSINLVLTKRAGISNQWFNRRRTHEQPE